MSRRVGRTADPNLKQGGRRAGGRPNGQKADKFVVRLGRPIGVALRCLNFFVKQMYIDTLCVNGGSAILGYNNVQI